MQFRFSGSFLENPLFQLQIIEAPFKKKIRLPRHQLLYVKKEGAVTMAQPAEGSEGRRAARLTRERLARVLLPLVRPLAMRERDVPVLDHVLGTERQAHVRR